MFVVIVVVIVIVVSGLGNSSSNGNAKFHRADRLRELGRELHAKSALRNALRETGCLRFGVGKGLTLL